MSSDSRPRDRSEQVQGYNRELESREMIIRQREGTLENDQKYAAVGVRDPWSPSCRITEV